MTTELLETIAQLEARVNELEHQLQNSEDELVRLRAELAELDYEMQFSRDCKESFSDIKLNIII